MTQNSQPLSLAEALSRLKGHITPLAGDIETLPIERCLGRIVAAPLKAPIDMPPFAASAMDGYAVRDEDWQADPAAAFTLVGRSLAGHPYTGAPLDRREAVRIYTGAALPPGGGRILLQEDLLTATEDQATFRPHQPTEHYVRPVGHDMQKDQLLAPPGTTLSALTLGMAAAAGIGAIPVYPLPRVGVFSTGDELVDPGIPPGQLTPGQIYDSNRLTVLSLLANLPIKLINLGRLPDDPGAVNQALAKGANKCHMLITSGGVSVGDADHITHTIRTLGQIEFWRLNLKPGKPLAYGQIDGCHIFGLPGNPVSTIVTLLMVAKPAIMQLCGGNPEPPLRVAAITTHGFTHQPGRTEYQRGILQADTQGLSVTPTGDQSSNRMTTFAAANCLVEIPGVAEDIAAGETVEVLPFAGLLQ